MQLLRAYVRFEARRTPHRFPDLDCRQTGSNFTSAEFNAMPRATSKSPARKRASSAAPKAKSASKSASKVSGATYKEIDFGVTEITKGKGWWGRENNPGGYTKYDTEILHSFNFSWTLTISLWIAVPSAIVFFTAQHYGFSFPQMDLMHVAKFAIAWFAVAIVVALPVFAFMMKIHSQQSVQVSD